MTTEYPRRSVLKATAITAGVGLLGRFAQAGELTASDYQSLDAWAMAEAVHRGELSPEALLEAALTRKALVDPRIGAVNMLHEEYARALLARRRAAGQQARGALAGVPLLLKDLNTSLQDTITSNGSRFFKNAAPATATSTLIARYEHAGAVPFGKTTCPEFGLTTTTESLAWGCLLYTSPSPRD